jgi:transposase-like protein
MYCKIKYTPNPKPWVYDESTRRKAYEMYVDGINLRRIGRHLGGIHHSTTSSWIKAYTENLEDPSVPEKVKEAEMDELFTFIGDKKTGSMSSPL